MSCNDAIVKMYDYGMFISISWHFIDLKISNLWSITKTSGKKFKKYIAGIDDDMCCFVVCFQFFSFLVSL